MKDLNLNALSDILLQRIFSALNLTEVSIRKFGDLNLINRRHMMKAQRYFGKAEAYLDIMKAISDDSYQSVINSEMYQNADKLLRDTEFIESRY